MNAAEQRLFSFVQAKLRSGASRIAIPADYLDNVSEAALQEIRALCTLSGARIDTIDA